MQAPRLTTLLADQFRLLAFRRPSPALAEHPNAYLVFGLVTAWAAGIGRYWDHPNASLLQYLGLGSVVYVPLLALLLTVFCGLLAPRHLPYRTVLGFVALTSLPAIFYAVPVERFLTQEHARDANAWFLGIVAAWRVALLAVFLRRAAAITGFALAVATVYPLMFIAAGLAVFNLEHAAFDIMSGIRNTTPYDRAYEVVQAIAGVSCMASIPMTTVFAWMSMRAARARSAARTAATRPPPGEPPPPRPS